MRSFMIAAALSVVALGFSGCAMTGGGCTSCDTTITDCGCGDMSGGDCGCGEAVPMGDVDACSCGGVGCDTCSKYGRTMGMHNAPTSDGSYGGGLTNTGMAMPLFARGVACNGPSCGIGTGRLRGALSSLAGCKDGCSTEEESCDECEVASGGLLGKLREANAIAIAEQEAAFDAAQAESGCGPGGCGGRLGGCGCGGAGTCAACLKGIAQYYHGHPYGGAVPHTTPPPAGAGASGAGMAPTYAYPYYTTRGPRDFLSRRPMDIGY